MNANKVTVEGMTAKIVDVRYFRHKTLTICVLELENGFMVVGRSACADPANYNLPLGQQLAYKNAFEKIWELEGYALRERLHRGGTAHYDIHEKKMWEREAEALGLPVVKHHDEEQAHA